MFSNFYGNLNIWHIEVNLLMEKNGLTLILGNALHKSHQGFTILFLYRLKGWKITSIITFFFFDLNISRFHLDRVYLLILENVLGFLILFQNWIFLGKTIMKWIYLCKKNDKTLFFWNVSRNLIKEIPFNFYADLKIDNYQVS